MRWFHLEAHSWGEVLRFNGFQYPKYRFEKSMDHGARVLSTKIFMHANKRDKIIFNWWIFISIFIQRHLDLNFYLESHWLLFFVQSKCVIFVIYLFNFKELFGWKWMKIWKKFKNWWLIGNDESQELPLIWPITAQ